MNVTLLLLIHVTLFLSVMIVIAYMFIKAMQTPANKTSRIVLSPEDHREIREKASIVIIPFSTDTHNE